MAARDPPPHYHAYLLRCWQEQSLHNTGLAGWRVSIEDPHTGQRRGFASFQALIAFLAAELSGEAPDAASAQGETDA
jgi:hypothetical protein